MRIAFAVVAVAVAVAAAGCGASQPASRAPRSAALRADLQGSPTSLAAIHAQANQLLGGGVGAYRARLAALKGRPVVVNVWASWCPPCRAEFPLFQSAGSKLGRRVAFLAVDTIDNRPAARAFLGKFPVSYPSYEDPSGAIARAITPGAGVPVTAFYDRAGRLVYFHQGGYMSEPTLMGDIRRYAMGS